MPIALAIGGGALVGAAGSIFGGIMGSNASKRQAQAIEFAAREGSKTALELDNRARADLQPFRDAGVKASDTIMSLLSGKGNLDDILKESSLFKFQSELGSRNINRELSARGLYGSGAGLESLARFNNQLVAEEGGRLFDRFSGVADRGANAAARMASNTAQTGVSLANMQTQAGIARGQAIGDAGRSIAGIGQGVANAVGGGIGQYAQYQLLAPLLNKASSGGSSGGNSLGLTS